MNYKELISYPSYDCNSAVDADNAYMKELYPVMVRKILMAVEDELDKMEYEGSPMFDLYPDRTFWERRIHAIYEHTKDEPEIPPTCALGKPCTPPDPEMDADGITDWRHQLIASLLYNEMVHRRRRYYTRKHNGM